jgi:hypothetical protein
MAGAGLMTNRHNPYLALNGPAISAMFDFDHHDLGDDE